MNVKNERCCVSDKTWDEVPNSREAERAILGEILINNALITQAIELLKPDDFYEPSHRLIFTTMIALHERGSDITQISIGEELKKEKHALQSVGGISGISELIVGLPRSNSLVQYADLIAEKATARKLLRALEKIAAQILEGDMRAAIKWALPVFHNLDRRINGKPGPRTVCMANVKSQPIEWIWFPFIPLGKITILEGEEGLGKSYLTCAIASAISRGHGLPKVSPFASANVLILSAEDGLADTIRPRLDSMGADMERIFAVDQMLTLDEKGMLLLEQSILKHQPILVVIDPLFSYTGAKIDINRANESRAVSAGLAAIAEKHNVAFLLVRHIGKSKGNGEARAAGLGSIDWRAAARSVLLVGRNPENNQKGFVQTKHNLTSEGTESIGFEIVPGPTRNAAGQFAWTDGCTLTAAMILAGIGDKDANHVRNDAATVLREILRDGPKPAKTALKEMRAAGFSKDQTRRGREWLGVIPQKEKGSINGKWVWSLPGGAQDGTSDLEDGKKDQLCHLQSNVEHKGVYNNALPEDGTRNFQSHHKRDLAKTRTRSLSASKEPA